MSAPARCLGIQASLKGIRRPLVMDHIVLGGASFRARPTVSCAFLPSSRGAFSVFGSSSSGDFDSPHVRLDYFPLNQAGQASGGGCFVWDACPDTKVFRDGDQLLLKTFCDGKPNELEWLSRLSGTGEVIQVYANSTFDGTGNSVFPGLDAYPHLRFILAWQLAQVQGLWLHASAALHKGKMYLFTGRSGRGKSTLSKLLHASGQFEIASDEKNVLRKTPEGFRAFGTPWTSSARLCSNISAPLAGIFFLDHAKENSFLSMTPGAALKKLIPQVHIPWFDEPLTQRIMQTLETLVGTVPCWALGFRPDREVVDRLVEFVDGR